MCRSRWPPPSADYGWSAEFEIPFSSLRYATGDVQDWGINFQRNIRRNNERAFWAPLDRQFSIVRVSDAGTLTGVAAPSQRNLQITPYVLARARRGDAVDGTSVQNEIGLDAKYSITPSLTLDVSYNTDFAQVEVDDVQVNLDRFSLFFPEKRAFFLENAGQFRMGNPEEVEFFFSRRIGIGAGGRPTPILVRRPVDREDRQLDQYRAAGHAHRGRAGHRARERFPGGAHQPGAAEPFVHRRHLRQSRGRWFPTAAGSGRREPHHGHRWSLGALVTTPR